MGIVPPDIMTVGTLWFQMGHLGALGLDSNPLTGLISKLYCSSASHTLSIITVLIIPVVGHTSGSLDPYHRDQSQLPSNCSLVLLALYSVIVACLDQ